MAEKKQAKKRIIIEVSILLVLMLLALAYLIGIHKADLTVPMNYTQQNTGDMLAYAKNICCYNWSNDIVEMGAPFNSNVLRQPGFFAQLIDAVLLKLIYTVTGNVAVALNLYMLLCFLLTALSSFWIMKKLRMSSFSSILGSVVFSTSTYIFMMGMTEFGMMGCYFIPVAIYFGIRIYEDEEFFQLDDSFFDNKKNFGIIGMVVLMCFNGAGYYAFFAGVVFIVAGISAAMKGFGKNRIFKALILSAIMLLVSLVFTIPYWMGTGRFYEYGTTVATAEIKGLKLIQMFLPLNDLGVGIFGRVINSYYKYTIVENNLVISSFLGIVGAIGFVVLMLALLTALVKKKKAGRLIFASEAVLILMLVSETGGIGALITCIFNGGLTDYAKGIIFIIYFAVLAFFIGFEWLVKRVGLLAVSSAVILIAVSILIQQPAHFSGFYGNAGEVYNQEKQFVNGMELELGRSAKIYQPSVVGTYNPVGGAIWEYNNRSIGYYLSNNLCWSIDVRTGKEAEGWRGHLNTLSVDDLVLELRTAGFEAIFIDRSNYETANYTYAFLTELDVLENELRRVIGGEFVRSGNLEYIKL